MYYAIANASAFTQDAAHRRWPRALNAVGLLGCLTLVATLPVASIAAGTAVLAIGGAGRAAARPTTRYGVTSPTNVPQSLMYGGKPNPPGMNSVAIQIDPSSPATAAE